MATQELAVTESRGAAQAKYASSSGRPRGSRLLFRGVFAVALVYAFLAGFRTIAEFDLGWQMATARWMLQHHQIPSADVLSYTAAGQPWIYPVGAGLLFYGLHSLGGYGLLSWLTALACVIVVAVLLRRGSLSSAILAILAIPTVTSRITPRAELFTVLLFAATLSLLWEQYETGKARLWILPILMGLWVNIHPGFIAGMGLLGAYVMLEVLEMLWADKRPAALGRLFLAAPWLAATVAAALLNPWGWDVFRVIARQEAAMGAHSQLILEWAPMPLTWMRLKSGLSPLDPDEFYVMLVLVGLAAAIALLRRQFGASILVGAAVIPPLRHMRFVALFGIIVVIVGGAIFQSFADGVKSRIPGPRLRSALAILLVLPFLTLAARRATNLITNQSYLSGTNLLSFGSGLSWWFPAKAAEFIQRENLPAQVFSTIEDGAYMAFHLGPRYKNYIDGRAIPFGTDLLLRSIRLKAMPPESLSWQQEAERYDINVIVIPIARFSALQFFPMLKQFCASDHWRPVYLDEVSVVYLRRTRQTEEMIRQLQIDCATAPLPAAPVAGNGVVAFNQWANAAAVLRALGRDTEALAAANKALAIYGASGYLHFLRGHMYEEAGDLADAERDYVLASQLEPNLVAPWSALASYYQDRGRMPEAIHAWEHAAGVSRWPWDPLVSLGYANLKAGRPGQALEAFDDAANSLPAQYDLIVDKSVLANIAHGRSRCWDHLGDLRRAILFDEEAARLLPDPDLWMQLAALYERVGRLQDAIRVRAQALALAQSR